MLKYDKIFVIGFNKTGTTSFHDLFIKYGLTSQHNIKWNIDNYQCFCDGLHNNGKYKNYYEKYPNSLFILNTRPLYNWLKSRSNHCFIHKKTWGWPPSFELYSDWINQRTEHFLDVMDFFKDLPSQLVICNIEKPNWQKFIVNSIGYQSHHDDSIHQNKIPESRIDKEPLKLINNQLTNTFLTLKLDINSLMPECDYLPRYNQYL